MTLLGKVELDVHLNAPAKKFHEIFRINPHLIASITPGNVKGVNKHQGDWGKVGSIIGWNYVHDGKTCVAKSVIEAIDAEKYSITLRVTEGDVLDQYKTFKIILEVIPKQNGSVAHWTFEYEKLHPQVPYPDSLMLVVTEVSRDIDSHLTQGLHHEDQLLGKVQVKVHIDASAKNYFEMLSNTPHHIANISPSKVQRASADANWGKLGSAITFHYVHEGKNQLAKAVIHAIDINKNFVTLRVVEGDLLKDFKSVYLTLQATPIEKGSVVHITLEYEKLKGHIADPHTLIQLIDGVSGDVSSHLAK